VPPSIGLIFLGVIPPVVVALIRVSRARRAGTQGFLTGTP
jgi:hypothetical protein